MLPPTRCVGLKQGYAITYLWTIFARSTPRSSPGFPKRLIAAEIACYRRYAASINANPEARVDLLYLVHHRNDVKPHEAAAP